MIIDELKKFLKSKNKKTWVKLVNNNEVYFKYVRELFPTKPMNEALYLIMNDMVCAPSAPCGSECKFINGSYDKYCSKPTKPNKNRDNGFCVVCNEHWKNTKLKTTKQKCIDTYGVEYHWQRNDVKDKIKSTNMKRYGVEHNSHIEHVLEKRKETFIKRYGVESPLASVEIRDKIKATNIEKYGVENYGSTDECIEKRNKTMMDLYGVNNAQHVTKFLNESKVTKAKIRYDKILSIINPSYKELFEYDDLIDSTNESKLPYYCEIHKGLFYSNYKYGIVCSVCNPPVYSSIQNEIKNFVSTLTECDIIMNDRSNGYEYDIYIPELQIAIEVNGMYWHKSDMVDKYYHRAKTINSIERGIRLIHIFEDEWYSKQKIIKNRLMNVFQCSSKIYARKCIVKKINTNICYDFLNTNHIQGYTRTGINYGLFYKQELVAVMTFSKSRYDKKFEYELIRYCSRGTVVGGAGKLLSAFERDYKPLSLMSYADLNWGSGQLYISLNFENLGYTEPKYFYYDPKTKQRFSRQKFRKHKLIEMGYNSSKTEEEICLGEIGLYKIYDSGNCKFAKYYYNINITGDIEKCPNRTKN
ncbi:putative homing endonuclease [Escherichia phage UE-S1]|nr:hypothetical protein UES1_010 [Escherichia phage UE-S1]UTS53961.1 putative homing endonuclease [Escherichia phage UE-S1]